MVEIAEEQSPNTNKTELELKRQIFETSWIKFSALLTPVKDSLEPLINFIEQVTNTELTQLEAKMNFAAYLIDLSAVKIQMAQDGLICFASSIRAEVGEIYRQITEQYYAQAMTGYTAIAVIDGPIDELIARFAESPVRVLFLNKKILANIFITTSWQESLATALVINSQNIDILSPYDENGVCSPELFTGRTQELEKLYYHPRSNCHALVGCRRVGKTSLMLDIKRRCELNGESTFYIDFQNCNSLEAFKAELVRKTRRKDYENLHHWTISEYLLRLASLEKNCVNLFLDEMDAIVSYDESSNYSIIKELVTATQGRLPIRIWMAGFKHLYWAIVDKHGPLYNKLAAEVIEPLAQKDAEQLISKPLAHLSITFTNKAKQIEQITAETNKHPGFIQLYCRLLVSILSQNDCNKIEDKHLELVKQQTDLRDYVQDYFAINTSSLEKMIVISTLTIREFNQEKVFHMLLEKTGIHLEYTPLYKELRDLRFGGIFMQKGESFSLQCPLLSDVLYSQASYIEKTNKIKANQSAIKVNAKCR